MFGSKISKIVEQEAWSRVFICECEYGHCHSRGYKQGCSAVHWREVSTVACVKLDDRRRNFFQKDKLQPAAEAENVSDNDEHAVHRKPLEQTAVVMYRNSIGRRMST